ncbi:MAG TPA: CRTAC1 family protein [Planctomycetota bacterium]
MLLAPVFFAALAAPELQGPSFEDATAAAGLSHAFLADPADPNWMAGGGAVGDFDGDGWPDVFLLGGPLGTDALYLNRRDGTFVEVGAAWGVAAQHRGIAASAADFDGDGWTDLFVTSHGPVAAAEPGKHRLYRNLAGQGFADVALAAGVAWSSPVVPDGFGSAWGDYEGDGDLDLFVSGWRTTSEGNRLFQNQGDGTFADVTVAAGVFEPIQKGFVPAFADMDEDGMLDLILIADEYTSRYWINQCDGTFRLLRPQPDGFGLLLGMGIAIADYDADGILDFYATNIEQQTVGNMLWWGQGGHGYVEDAVRAGVWNAGWCWGAAATDFENDGWPDIVALNGWHGTGWENEAARLYSNRGDHTFDDLALVGALVHTGQGRTPLRLDFDRDGREDLLLISNDEPAALFRNVTPAAGHWLRLRFDTSAHAGLAPQGFGTRVRLRTGGRTLMRYLDGAPSYLGTHEPALHFGLGAAARVDSLEVIWADGSRRFWRDLDADRELILTAGMQLELGPTLPRRTLAVASLHASPADLAVLIAGIGGAGAWKGGRGTWLDLLPPFRPLAVARAGAGGIADLSFAVPRNLPLGELAFQAVARRRAGPGRSNVLFATVTP